jgi:hypothetical protein
LLLSNSNSTATYPTVKNGNRPGSFFWHINKHCTIGRALIKIYVTSLKSSLKLDLKKKKLDSKTYIILNLKK